METKEFKVGQVWRTQGGESVTIMEIDKYAGYPIRGDDYADRNMAGQWIGGLVENERDLVELLSNAAPNPEAIADKILEQAGETMTAELGAVSVLGTPPATPDRADNYAQIILRGMMESMEPKDIRPYIDLFDSAVDGTSGPVDLA